ncbi:UNVERIFIED_CONTAM: hypothetical protein K2H54_046403 [Gekko kuhli]
MEMLRRHREFCLGKDFDRGIPGSGFRFAWSYPPALQKMRPQEFQPPPILFLRPSFKAREGGFARFCMALTSGGQPFPWTIKAMACSSFKVPDFTLLQAWSKTRESSS